LYGVCQFRHPGSYCYQIFQAVKFAVASSEWLRSTPYQRKLVRLLKLSILPLKITN